MPVAILMKIVKLGEDLKVQVRWKGLSPKHDTLELIQNVYEDGSKMLDRVLSVKQLPITSQVKYGRQSIFNEGSVMLRHAAD